MVRWNEMGAEGMEEIKVSKGGGIETVVRKMGWGWWMGEGGVAMGKSGVEKRKRWSGTRSSIVKRKGGKD